MSTVPSSWSLLDAARTEGLSVSAIDTVVAPAALLLALRWADEHDAERVAIATFNGEEARTILPPGLRWSVWRQAPRPLTAAEVTALWSGIRGVLGLPVDPRNAHHEVRFKSGRLLSHLVAWLEQYPLDTPAARRQAGEAFTELVLRAMDIARFGGEFVTPRPIARLMVAMADPRPGERIYDPCFGTGGLLVDAADTLWSHAHEMSPAEWLRAVQTPVFGVEKNVELHLIAFVRLLLAGVRPALEVGDALEREAAGRHHDQGFDCVLVDPPIGSKVAQEHLYDFPIHGKTSENLFAQHAVRSLRPGGRAVISVAPGLLFRGGADYELRRWLLSEYQVEAVVRLPTRSRLPYTGIRPSLLVIRRAPPAKVVRFVELLSIPETEEACRQFSALLRDRADLSPHTVVDREIEDLLRTDATLDISSAQEVAPDEALAELAAKVELRPLGEVATVTAGVSVRRDAIVEGDEPGAVPLVRVGDLSEGVLRVGERFLRPEARVDVRPDQFIRHGDVLVSVDGTIGKVLFVRHAPIRQEKGEVGAVGRFEDFAIAQRGLVIVRPHQILDAQFLQAILASEAFQGLLRRLARGETIAHLPLKTLREIRVPVPPVAMQRRLLQKLADQPADAVEALMAILVGRDENPLARLLREDSSTVRISGEGVPEPKELYQLGLDVFTALARLRNQAVHGGIEVDANTFSWLRTVGTVPALSARRGNKPLDSEALEATKTMLDHAASSAAAVGGLFGRQIVRLTDRLILWVDAAKAEVAANFELQLKYQLVERSMTVPGEADVLVTVTLSGTGALHDFAGGLDVAETTEQLPELVPGQVAHLRFVLPEWAPWVADENRKILTLTFRWSAKRIDDELVEGEETFFIEGPKWWNDLASPARTEDLGVSPYITGPVVDSPEMFFGREAILADIRTHLGGGTKVILLEGNRRSGKTSILRQLQRPEMGLADSWVLVECSFQGATGHPTKTGIPTINVFRHMVRTIFEACAKAGCPVALPDTPMEASRTQLAKALTAYFRGVDPYEALQIYVDQVIQSVAPKRLLLMLDEFDKLQEGIESGVTSPQVSDNIRHLFQTRPGVSAIITGLGSLKRLRENYWSALFGFGHSIGVKPLEPSELRDLVTRPVEGRLTFERSSLDLIEELTARQPYLAQTLCARIFELAKANGRRHVRLDEVREAESRMVRDNEHFQALWSYAGSERRRYLLCLCSRLADGSQRLNADLFNEHLREAGIVVPLEHVDDDLKSLVELELVTMRTTPLGPQYGLAVPLMKRWMDLNVDAEAQRRKAVYEQQHAGSAFFTESRERGANISGANGSVSGIEEVWPSDLDPAEEQGDDHE
jgi:type I restriction enzyme M protein